MKNARTKPVRCAIYTRVSTEHGLEQDFNSLDAQYDAAQAYIRSQAHAGWTLIRTRYDDGGYSGSSTERPALQQLLADVRERKVDACRWLRSDARGACRALGRGDLFLGPHVVELSGGQGIGVMGIGRGRSGPPGRAAIVSMVPMVQRP